MNIKKPSLALPLLPILAGLCMEASPSMASPLVSIGDNADLYFNGSSSLRWTSNVYRDKHDDKDDLIWTVSPGFELNVGRGLSNMDLSIITRYDIIRYNDESDNDTEQFYISANGSYRGSRLDLNTYASFGEFSSTSSSVNVDSDLIEYERTAGGVNGEYRFSPKTSIGSGFNYSKSEYTNYEDRFADVDQFNVPIDIYYELTPKVDLSLGYKYRQTSTDGTLQEIGRDQEGRDQGLVTGGYDSDSHFFNVGARGYLLPKVTGFFKIGYMTRNNDNSSRQEIYLDTGDPVAPSTKSDQGSGSGTLGLDSRLTWAATPKLTATLALGRDYGTGGEGQSTENTTTDLGATYDINTRFVADANFSYSIRDYKGTGREDNQYRAGVGFSYSANQYWSLRTAYDYTDNDSDIGSASYEDHSLSLSASLRY